MTVSPMRPYQNKKHQTVRHGCVQRTGKKSGPVSLSSTADSGSLNRREFLGAAAGTAAVLGGGVAPALARGHYQWRMVTTWPANFPGMGSGVHWLAETVNRLSGGRLTIKVYGAGELVPAFEAMDAVINGTADLGHGAPYYWKGKAPASEFLAAVPFGLTAQEQNAWLYFGGGLELATRIYSELGCRFFPAGNTGVQMGGWFNRHIDTLDDFKGLRIRMPGLGGEVLKAAGATVVNLPGGDIPTALQSGAIDAAEWIGPYNDLAFGFHKSSDIYYTPGWHEPALVFDCFVNQAAYESLPADLQAIFSQACQAANQRILSTFISRNGAALKALTEKHGTKVTPYPPEVLKGLGRLSTDVLDELASKDTMSREVYDSIVAFRARAWKWSDISQNTYVQARQAALGS